VKLTGLTHVLLLIVVTSPENPLLLRMHMLKMDLFFFVLCFLVNQIEQQKKKNPIKIDE
jgi:hypothetical protein